MQPRDGALEVGSVRTQHPPLSPLGRGPPSVAACLVVPYRGPQLLNSPGEYYSMSPMAGTPPPGGGRKIENPHWQGIEELCAAKRAEIRANVLHVRAGNLNSVWALSAKYGSVIPDPGLLSWLVNVLGRWVVEIDAGAGYWSWMLDQMGVSVITYDARPPHEAYVTVEKSGRDRAELRHDDNEYASLLCVMPRSFATFFVSLNEFSGRTFVVITDSPKVRNDPESFATPQWSWHATKQGVFVRGGTMASAYLYRRAVRPTDPPSWHSTPTMKLRTLPNAA